MSSSLLVHGDPRNVVIKIKLLDPSKMTTNDLHLKKLDNQPMIQVVPIHALIYEINIKLFRLRITKTHAFMVWSQSTFS